MSATDSIALGDRMARRNALLLAVASGSPAPTRPSSSRPAALSGAPVRHAGTGDAAGLHLRLRHHAGDAARRLRSAPARPARRLHGRQPRGRRRRPSGRARVYLGSFALFCLATALAGVYQAVVQSYRYAAADTASPDFRPKAISWVLTGGVAAAFIGPQLVIWTKELMLHTSSSRPSSARPPSPAGHAGDRPLRGPEEGGGHLGEQRPLSVLLRQPRLIVAIACGTLAQALMNFVMTAAPLAMVQCGHTIVDATLGIQWHIIAMFGPSFGRASSSSASARSGW